MKLEYFLTTYTKISSKWIKGINVRPETIKLLEENIGRKLSNINHSKVFYDPPPRVMEIKAKIKKKSTKLNSKQTGSGQTGDSKSEHGHSEHRNQ